MSARPYLLPFLSFSLLALANYLFRREGKRRGRGGRGSLGLKKGEGGPPLCFGSEEEEEEGNASPSFLLAEEEGGGRGGKWLAVLFMLR